MARPKKKDWRTMSDAEFAKFRKEKERERQLLEASGLSALHDCDEVALMLKIHKETLYERMMIDYVPHTKVGGSIRFTDENIQDFLKYHQSLKKLAMHEIKESEGDINELEDLIHRQVDREYNCEK